MLYINEYKAQSFNLSSSYQISASLYLLMLIIGSLSLILINYWMLFHSMLMILLLIQAVISFRKKDKWTYYKFISYFLLALALSEVLLLFHYHYFLFCLNAFSSIIIGLTVVTVKISSHYKNQFKKSASMSTKFIAVVEATALSVVGFWFTCFVLFLMVVAVKPSVGIDLFVNKMNSHEPIHESTSTILEEGTVYWNDIRYGTTYPRSFLDIYKTNEDDLTLKPTFIFIHGGGFVQGDKVMGDPNSSNMGSKYYFPFIERGYNVVAINYAFAPEYRYPTPILQLNEAVDYLKEHAHEYGLDMDNVVIGGNSAGGHIAGQFALIQTNQEYAKTINIQPVLEQDSIKAVILNSSLLEPAKFDESGDWTFDYQLSAVARAYWGNDFETNQLAKEANIVDHVTKEYPPVFITDGNTSSFYEQAKLFDSKLDELGVEHVFNFYEKNQVILTHSYETIFVTEQAFENMEMMFDFLEKQLP